MYSTEYLRQLSADAAVNAAERDQSPLICEDEGDYRHIPSIGDYIPEGWEFVESYFVDSCGFGSPGEPALTFSQFVAEASQYPSDGFAITQEGQFQVYIGRFRREA